MKGKQTRLRREQGTCGFKLDLHPPALQMDSFCPGLEFKVEKGLVVSCSGHRLPLWENQSETVGDFKSAADYFMFFLKMRRRLGVAMAFEKLLEKEISAEKRQLRTLELELLRVTGNLYWLTVAASLLGGRETAALALEDAELGVEMMIELSSFLSTSYSPELNFVRESSSQNCLPKLKNKLTVIDDHLDRHEESFLKSSFLLSLSRKIGVIDIDTALDCGLSGPVLRAAGLERDRRLDYFDNLYEQYKFKIPVGSNGDVADRFKIRFLELRQDVDIIGQVLEQSRLRNVKEKAERFVRFDFSEEDEGVAVVRKGDRIVATGDEIYFSLPTASGEMSFYIKTAPNEPHLKLCSRSPGFLNLFSLEKLAPGQSPEDLVAMAASLGVF